LIEATRDAHQKPNHQVVDAYLVLMIVSGSPKRINGRPHWTRISAMHKQTLTDLDERHLLHSTLFIYSYIIWAALFYLGTNAQRIGSASSVPKVLVGGLGQLRCCQG
jgi:hypothetical protein